MKITNNLSLTLIAFALLLTMTLCNSNNKFLEQEGTATNYESTATTDAVSFALAKTTSEDIYVNNQKGFKSPDFVDKLPLSKPIETGPPETIDEIPSIEDYYDGAKGIKTSVSFCSQFITKPQACVNQGSCGWCMGEGTCIGGSAKGPAVNGDCLRGKYVFEAPNADWNPITIPNTKLSRTNVLGAQLTTIVQQP